MENPIPAPLLERNVITHQRHRSEVLWQITIPFLVCSVFLVLLLFLALTPDKALSISQKADVAVIWLLVSVIFLYFIFLTMLVLVSYLVIRTIGILPHYFKDNQDLFMTIQTFFFQTDDRLTRPVIKAHEFGAYVSAAARKVLGK